MAGTYTLAPLTFDPSKQYDWSDLVNSMPVTIALKAHIGDAAEGDTFALLRHHDGRYGLSVFGWASCSECDVLKGCKTLDDLTEVRDNVWNGIHWEDNATALLAYLDNTDLALKWWGHTVGGRDFAAQAKRHLVRLATAS
ncbi:hypothetical protein [Planomonospora sp. ID82291]|uniref:hypothetical protein n=1 Tax=Planomonospora sp. ID82291 TaxID=2738136 RepID=UPI0018C42624|nr:hypothetical protein [Planomonospora sp. ID82291]MBG0818297.1 hypothetical protein [Planomonospora sp. ID82291]